MTTYEKMMKEQEPADNFLNPNGITVFTDEELELIEQFQRPEVKKLYYSIMSLPPETQEYAIWSCQQILNHKMTIPEAKALFKKTGGIIPDTATATA